MIPSKYILEPGLHKKLELKQRLDKYGIQKCFDDIYPWLDCTKIVNEEKGWRKNQTINIYYRIQLGEILYMLSVCDNPNKIDYLNLIEERHNNNIEFEKINPPIDYDEPTRKIKKRKSKEIDTESIVKKRREKVEKITKGFKFLVNGPIV